MTKTPSPPAARTGRDEGPPEVTGGQTLRALFRAEWAESLPAGVQIEPGEVLDLEGVELVVVAVERPVTEDGRPMWPELHVALEGAHAGSSVHARGIRLSARQERRERALRELEAEVERSGNTPAVDATPHGRLPTTEELLAAAETDPGWGEFIANGQSSAVASQCAEYVRTGLYARRRLEDFAGRGRWGSLATEAEREAGEAGGVDVRSAIRARTTRRLAYLAALRNPTLLRFLFPDGTDWPESAMRADWDRWGMNGEPEQERHEADPDRSDRYEGSSK